MNSNEYLESIKKKLDAMNKVAGANNIGSQKSQYEPNLIDPFHAQGLAALKYMEEQKKKNQSL